MLERAEEVGAEAAAVLVGTGEAIAGENAREKILGEVAGFVVVAAFAAEVGEDGVVVGVAEFAEGSAGFG